MGVHEGRFQAKSHLSYAGIIHCLSLEVSFVLCVSMPVNFIHGGDCWNFPGKRMNKIEAYGRPPEATDTASIGRCFLDEHVFITHEFSLFMTAVTRHEFPLLKAAVSRS